METENKPKKMETICKKCKHCAITVHDKTVLWSGGTMKPCKREPTERMHCKKFNVKQGAMLNMIECSEFK